MQPLPVRVAGGADGDARAAKMPAASAQGTAMAVQISKKQIGLPAGLKRPRMFTMQGKQFFKVVAVGGEAGEFRHGAVMLRQFFIFYRPVGYVRIAMRQHGRAPDVAQAAEGERRFQTGAVVPPGNFFLGFAIRKIRAKDQFDRHAFRIGGHVAFQRGDLGWIPRWRVLPRRIGGRFGRGPVRVRGRRRA